MKRRSLSEPGPAAAGSEMARAAPAHALRRLFVLDTNVLMHDPTAIYLSLIHI